jgi:hypothetical protein
MQVPRSGHKDLFARCDDIHWSVGLSPESCNYATLITTNTLGLGFSTLFLLCLVGEVYHDVGVTLYWSRGN